MVNFFGDLYCPFADRVENIFESRAKKAMLKQNIYSI